MFFKFLLNILFHYLKGRVTFVLFCYREEELEAQKRKRRRVRGDSRLSFNDDIENESDDEEEKADYSMHLSFFCYFDVLHFVAILDMAIPFPVVFHDFTCLHDVGMITYTRVHTCSSDLIVQCKLVLTGKH